MSFICPLGNSEPVLGLPAEKPIPMLPSLIVIPWVAALTDEPSAFLDIATLLNPSVFSFKESTPIAMLFVPSVVLAKAPTPKATFAPGSGEPLTGFVPDINDSNAESPIPILN